MPACILPGRARTASCFITEVRDSPASNDRLAKVASGERVAGAPDLVIEIVSPGIPNAQRDQVVEKQIHGKYGVKEYWLVDLVTNDRSVHASERHTRTCRNLCRTGRTGVLSPARVQFCAK